ncbi:histidine biosynthesis trifunctional protein [Phanerochaete sordida]|uniref:Histidine biosynthesis trifunctional protein n=1 Tax=Phanerochaete sordida TaxID=48140 RepID=A0A9P3FW76_9APHY|nr:histidine biosynthesis trifunctional protein [Phanerochaete sordida]
MTVFAPLLDGQVDEALLVVLQRIGPVIVPALSSQQISGDVPRYILLDHDTSLNLDEVIQKLDQGAEKVIVPLAWAKEVVGVVPASRVLLLLDASSVSAVSETVRNGVSGVLLKSPALDADFITSMSRFFKGQDIHVLPTDPGAPLTPAKIRELRQAGAIPVIPASQLTLAEGAVSQLNVGDAYTAPLVSDRPDGLYPTVVSEGGRSLGLVYSSIASVKESILTGKGVYQSRKHGLWRKGETSGAVQDVRSIKVDCDLDSLEFEVVQHGVGFCHLNRASCFGHNKGLPLLERTLQSRLAEAPEGSYTRRLFNDPALLRAKIMEEADELCRAETKEEVAFEAADLIYFALTKCTAAGVSIADIERSLDQKAKKVTRRPGNAKPQWVNAEASSSKVNGSAPPAAAAPKPDQDAPIRMRTYTLSECSPAERARLLKRPVLNSDAMIAKVRPIVDAVRTGGDAALMKLVAQFDRCTVLKDTPILRAPFPELSDTELDPEVRKAIDVAYANVRTFHAAQAETTALRVETMPGVVCSRFARPIARVGLYVPGGTAILPSTALMLGVPAQVAGCQEVVLATPPRADGSISPEVMYCAKLVGASAILRAGGAQAVAAMAYGTETVPKVDKIFGPGNQWVTAAKMLVQNDTDALVSIDMPAGPSEVLVIADETCNPAFVASDLLSQAEHGVDSQVVLVAVNLPEHTISAIEAEVDAQARALPRVDIMRESIPKSIIVKTTSVQEAFSFSNDYAPEHLILHLADAPSTVALVQNAGSVFVGPYSPESCGDYASGTNHTLPTNGYARQFSGVNTQSFQKHITSQEITASGLKNVGPVVATLADCEGLGAHANAVRIRLRTLQ